jgi:hypothetical protein
LNLPFTAKATDEKIDDNVTIALGWPDMGANNDMTSNANQATQTTSAPKISTSSDVVTNNNTDVNVAAQKEVEAQKQSLKEIDEQLKIAQQKENINNVFKNLNKNANGSGDNNKPDNGGRENGNPNVNNLEGNGVGFSVGDGLGGRGVKNTAAIPKTYNENGVVKIKVCIDASGTVISATVLNIGTTTSSVTLRDLALQNAKNLRFSSGDTEQCGTVNYSFKVK